MEKKPVDMSHLPETPVNFSEWGTYMNDRKHKNGSVQQIPYPVDANEEAEHEQA